jgi:hypothetical protein
VKLVLVSILKTYDWINLNEGRIQWEAVVSTEMDLPVANGAGNSLSIRATIALRN